MCSTIPISVSTCTTPECWIWSISRRWYKISTFEEIYGRQKFVKRQSSSTQPLEKQATPSDTLVRFDTSIQRFSELSATHRCEIMNNGSNPCHFWHFYPNLQLWKFMITSKVATMGVFSVLSVRAVGRIMKREASKMKEICDRLRDSWKEYHESRRCSRDTYPESCIIKYTSIQRKKEPCAWTNDGGPLDVAPFILMYRGTSLIRNRAPPETTLGP